MRSIQVQMSHLLCSFQLAKKSLHLSLQTGTDPFEGDEIRIQSLQTRMRNP